MSGPITGPQADYIELLRAKVRMKPATLDAYLWDRFAATLSTLTLTDASSLIDTLKTWSTVPADVLRLAGEPAPERLEGF